jgi:hypothetical protein
MEPHSCTQSGGRRSRMRGDLLGSGIRVLGHTQYLEQSGRIQTSTPLLDCAEWISPASD